MIFGPTGCASYLLGCTKAKQAVVVDALRSLGIEEYLMEAADRGLQIVHVIDTHTHADHLSAGLELAQACGATYWLSDQTKATVDHQSLTDGAVVQIGEVRVEALTTPGHTPDSLCLLVTDQSRSDEPWFLLTGDTLFVGDVGRPDLLVGDRELDVTETAQRARVLYQSLQQKIFTLPGYVEIYPGHFGGSACGGVNMSGKASSTLRFEKRYNLAMQQDSEEAFCTFVLQTLRPQPLNFQQIKRQNLGLVEV